MGHLTGTLWTLGLEPTDNSSLVYLEAFGRQLGDAVTVEIQQHQFPSASEGPRVDGAQGVPLQVDALDASHASQSVGWQVQQAVLPWTS